MHAVCTMRMHSCVWQWYGAGKSLATVKPMRAIEEQIVTQIITKCSKTVS